eukprot:CAMPEP_0182465610 /NCGR_PEP_ID=MMETSP1319-20130603/10294_1 /TAXON_ID=172717 /ORGANISM="Bolidomonas pacifica, Strain RCC208" /LENGTH=52 /DNA_ID=CAMNT_0024665415 /DNA_START=716 /DNA_END=874 /DNA_ORIENTATION=+
MPFAAAALQMLGAPCAQVALPPRAQPPPCTWTRTGNVASAVWFGRNAGFAGR